MKHMNLKFHVLSLMVVLSMMLAAFTPTAVFASSGSSTQTIAQIAGSDPQFSTLVAALQTAGLVNTLNSSGTFTVFAPTNRAFDKLGSATIQALLNDKPKLTGILLYHVLGSVVSSKAAAKAGYATTLNGQDVVISKRHEKLFINNARVIVRDIQASNGVIHVIDTVLLPPSKDIVDTLAARPEFSTLVAAVKAAGLVDTLKSAGPFTIFAPTNKAFAKLPKGTVEALLKDPEALKAILLYHAVSGKVYSADARKLKSAVTINGAAIKIHVDENELEINQAEVIRADVLATNGVIHIIDAVLIPPK